MIALLKSSSDLLPCLTTLCPKIFDTTFASFAICHSVDENELRECIRRESTNEHEYRTAEMALDLAKQRMSQLGHASRPSSSLMLIPTSFSSHQEISQLCLVLDFIILTLKGNLAGDFLLFNVSGYGTDEQLQHLFVRLFNQLIDYWLLMSSGSPELLREKNEIHRDAFSILNTVAQCSPSTLLTLFEEEISHSSPNQTLLLNCMATGAQPKNLQSLAAATVCIQTWTSLILYVLRSRQLIESTYQINVEAMLFDRLKFALFMHHVTQLSFLLDMENPQHGKVKHNEHQHSMT